MFIAFKKSEEPSREGKYRLTVDCKREVVLKNIAQWVDILHQKPCARVQKLSTLIDGRRFVWLKFGMQNVPLTAAGDLVGEIDPAQDEVEFWHWMTGQIKAGVYDDGILQTSAEIAHRMNAAKIARAGRQPPKAQI